MAPHLSFEFKDGSRETVVPTGYNERVVRMCGPVLSSVLEMQDDGTHINVPELADKNQAASLLAFLRDGAVPRCDVIGIEACYRVAAERLDIPEFVLAVERALISSIAMGYITLERASQAFAGCQRVQAICDHYVGIPGHASRQGLWHHTSSTRPT